MCDHCKKQMFGYAACIQKRSPVRLEKVDYALHGEKDQPLENVIQEEGEKELLEAMKILPEKLRLVLELRYFHEYSNGEIAKILDISKKNVEIRLYRAKKKMKEVLQYERERQEI